MKKLVLSFGLTLLAANSFSQVVFHIEAPSTLEGGYAITNPTNWSADMSDPANAVLDTLVLGQDSMGCAPLTNNVSGKIALLYRGTCDFSAKALAAQNAGAVAVVIINNIPGPPVGMGAGSSATSVTIPVIMISQADGALIHDNLDDETMVAFIGEKNGFFMDDIGMQVQDIIRAKSYAIPSQVSQNASEFSSMVGAWVHNYGQNDETGITLNAKVNNGSNVYDQTSNSFDVLAGDSAFIALPDFSLASYPMGTYTMTYALTYSGPEQYIEDNTFISKFEIQDTLLSYARLDENGKPITTIGTQPADNATAPFTSCITFMDNNASRIGAAGLYFSGAINAPDSLNGQEIGVIAYRWNDQFTDLNDGNFSGVTDYEEQTSTLFYFTGNPNNVAQYVAFPEPFVMEDGQRYLFCVQSFDSRVFFGYDEEINYVTMQENSPSPQPIYPIQSGTDWSTGGFVSNAAPSIAVRIFDASDLSINENAIETSAFPNPAKDVITVKVNANGTAVLKVTDLAGRIVSTQDVTIANGQFVTNVAGFNSGTYVFSLAYANGTNSQFKVVVTK